MQEQTSEKEEPCVRVFLLDESEPCFEYDPNCNTVFVVNQISEERRVKGYLTIRNKSRRRVGTVTLEAGDYDFHITEQTPPQQQGSLNNTEVNLHSHTDSVFERTSLRKISLPFKSRMEILIQNSRKEVSVKEGLEEVFADDPKSCTCISIRVEHYYASVRKSIVHDLLNFGVNHGYVRRVSERDVDVFIVERNPVDATGLLLIANYFKEKWGVTKEFFIVDENNYTEIDYCKRGFFVYRSVDRNDNSLDEEFDMISVDGFELKSEVSNPVRLVFNNA